MNYRMHRARVCALSIALVLAIACGCSARVICVWPAGLDTNSGTGWAAAKKSIQAGINAAAAGDEVWAGAGTYRERIVLKAGVALFGGFSGSEALRDQRNPQKNLCTLDGAKGGSVVTAPTGAGPATVIDGFTITNGTGTSQGGVLYGGGIYAVGASPTVTGNILISNTAANGAGLYCDSPITVRGNTFKQNNATLYGGGAVMLYGPQTVEGNTFESNRANSGGGLSVPYGSGVISANTFRANYATTGGSIHCMGSHPLISANTFTDNSGLFGAAIAYNGGAGVTSGNWMSGNKALISGGSLFCYSGSAESIVNNVFINGSAGFGGAIATKASNPQIVNNTVCGSTASSGGGGIAFVETGGGTASNNIIVSCSSGIYADPGLTPSLACNNLYGNASTPYTGVAAGEGDLSVDPGFVNRAGLDFRLAEGSPCIDAGTSNGAPATDRDSAPRPLDGDGNGRPAFDIGAYEAPERKAPLANISVSPCQGTYPALGEMTVAVVHSEPGGYQKAVGSYALINSGLSGLGGIYLWYDVTGNKLYLRDDANRNWLGGIAPGAAGVVSNSSCRVLCAQTTVSGAGPLLTVNWRIEVLRGMQGKNCGVWLYVIGSGGAAAGWDRKGVLLFDRPPANVSISPPSGSLVPGVGFSISAVSSDPDGYADIQGSYAVINTKLSSAQAISLWCDAKSRKLYLRNDANTAWLGGFAPGQPGAVIENGSCRIDCSRTTVTGSSDTLTVNWWVEPKAALAGQEPKAWLYVVDSAGLSDGWDEMGSYRIEQPDLNVSLTPVNASLPSGIPLSLTAAYRAPNGKGCVTGAYLLINSSQSPAKGVYLWYDGAANRLYLRNDAGTAWLGGFAPGSASVIQNSSAKVYCDQTSADEADGELRLTWRVEFSEAICGRPLKGWMYFADSRGLSDGWDQRGAFSVEKPGSRPQNLALSPSRGALPPGATLILRTAWADADGADRLKGCYVLLNSTVSAAQAIYLYYDAVRDLIYIRNDAGTAWTGGSTPGSSAVLENSYFRLYCLDTEVTESGLELAVTWWIEPKAALAGRALKAWLYAVDADNQQDGWDQFGEFTASPG